MGMFQKLKAMFLDSIGYMPPKEQSVMNKRNKEEPAKKTREDKIAKRSNAVQRALLADPANLRANFDALSPEDQLAAVHLGMAAPVFDALVKSGYSQDKINAFINETDWKVRQKETDPSVVLRKLQDF